MSLDHNRPRNSHGRSGNRQARTSVLSAPYQSNADYLEAFKEYLKVTKSHNGTVGLHPGLSSVALKEEKYHQKRHKQQGKNQAQRNISTRQTSRPDKDI